jgi:hypothetical protein
MLIKRLVELRPAAYDINNLRVYLMAVKNEGESAASFYRQMAALFPAMFCYSYLVKNHKIVKNSTTNKAREKSTDLESLELY